MLGQIKLLFVVLTVVVSSNSFPQSGYFPSNSVSGSGISQQTATDSVGLKRFSTSVVRFSSHDIQTLVMGVDANAAPNHVVLRTTNGSGTDITGANITIAGGQGTGTGTGGDLIFQTASAGGTGSSLNALSTRFRVSNTGNFGFGTNNYGSSSSRVFAIANGTAPTSTVSNQFMFFATGGEPVFRSGGGLVSTVSHVFGALKITSSQAQTLAANSWTKITGTSAETSPAANGCTAVSDSISGLSAGTYRVFLAITANTASVTNDNVIIAISNAGVVDTDYQQEHDLMTASGNVSWSVSGLYTVSASGVLAPAVKNITDGDDINVTKLSFIAQRIN